ncbi:hypothetical protein [Bacteroides acidifaciens]|uniref:hypothetical protein n=1 Tax=Bacteroides acidifaciens TaxID=85831 RepID=UPI003F694713
MKGITGSPRRALLLNQNKLIRYVDIYKSIERNDARNRTTRERKLTLRVRTQGTEKYA